MTLDKAVKIFMNFYAKAVKAKYIAKPIAYSLHQTWKYVDAREKARRPDEVRE